MQCWLLTDEVGQRRRRHRNDKGRIGRRDISLLYRDFSMRLPGGNLLRSLLGRNLGRCLLRRRHPSELLARLFMQAQVFFAHLAKQSQCMVLRFLGRSLLSCDLCQGLRVRLLSYDLGRSLLSCDFDLNLSSSHSLGISLLAYHLGRNLSRQLVVRRCFRWCLLGHDPDRDLLSLDFSRRFLSRDFDPNLGSSHSLGISLLGYHLGRSLLPNRLGRSFLSLDLSRQLLGRDLDRSLLSRNGLGISLLGYTSAAASSGAASAGVSSAVTSTGVSSALISAGASSAATPT